MRLAITTPHLRLFAALSVIALAGCDPEARINAMAPPDMDARARAYLQLLARGQVDSAFERLAPSLRTSEARDAMVKVSAMLAHRSLDSSQRVGVQVNDMNDMRHLNLTYQFHDSLGWLMANVATVEDRRFVATGDWTVEGFSVRPLPASLESTTAFTLAGRSARHYLWLLAAVVAAVVSIGTAIRVGMSRGMPRRWLWTFVALLGVVRCSLDWSTGAWQVVPLQVLLFSAAFLRMGNQYAPWIISFGFPLGAIVAEQRRRRWRRTPPAVTPSEPVTPPAQGPVLARGEISTSHDDEILR